MFDAPSIGEIRGCIAIYGLCETESLGSKLGPLCDLVLVDL